MINDRIFYKKPTIYHNQISLIISYDRIFYKKPTIYHNQISLIISYELSKK